MALLGSEEASNKALQVKLTALVPETSAAQAGSVTTVIEQKSHERSAIIVAVFLVTQIKSNSIIRTSKK